MRMNEEWMHQRIQFTFICSRDNDEKVRNFHKKIPLNNDPLFYEFIIYIQNF